MFKIKTCLLITVFGHPCELVISLVRVLQNKKKKKKNPRHFFWFQKKVKKKTFIHIILNKY